MIKESTASVFLWKLVEDRWCLGLIEHPRLGKLLLPGGHVELWESAAEAAVRETLEESGYGVRLLGWPSLPLPTGYPHPGVTAPWSINELMVPADNHTTEPHVHVDHQFLGLALSQAGEPVHPFRWVGEQLLPELDVVADTRMLAAALFPIIAEIAAAAKRGDAALARLLAGLAVDC